VAKLSDGSYAVITQLTLDTVQTAAATLYGIAKGRVEKSGDAGIHMEVAFFVKFGSELSAIGASQGFCPFCRLFLAAKTIPMEGPPRETPCQKWKSPEFLAGEEKSPTTAAYPWYFFKDEIEGKRLAFKTKADYDDWIKKRTS